MVWQYFKNLKVDISHDTPTPFLNISQENKLIK